MALFGGDSFDYGGFDQGQINQISGNAADPGTDASAGQGAGGVMMPSFAFPNAIAGQGGNSNGPNVYIPGYGYSDSGYHPSYSTGNPMGAVAGMMAGLGMYGGSDGGYAGGGGGGHGGGISPGVARYYENLAWLNQQRADINEQYNNVEQREQQGLISRGLGGSTIVPTMVHGVERERTAALARLPSYGGPVGFTSMNMSGGSVGGYGGWATGAGGGGQGALARLHAAGMSPYGGWKGY